MSETSCSHAAEKPCGIKEVSSFSEHHGHMREDLFAWMCDREDPAVTAYIEEENNYSDFIIEQSARLRDELFNEMKARIADCDESAPVLYGDYCYYTRFESGNEYPVYLRSRDGVEEVVLDQNKLAEGKSFCSIGSFKPSSDNKKLLYSVDFEGNELFEIRIRDIEKGFELDDIIFGTSGECEWLNDVSGFFYTLPDETHRPCSLFLHKLDTLSDRDEHILTEENKSFAMGIEKSRNSEYLFIVLASLVSAKVYYMNIRDGIGEITLLTNPEENIESYPDCGEGRFYLRTNKNSLNFRIICAEISSPMKWRDFIPHSDDFYIEDFAVFKNFIAVQGRKEGSPAVYIYNLKGDKIGEVPLPISYATVDIRGNKMFDTDRLRISSESFFQPYTAFDFQVSNRKLEIVKVKKIPCYTPSEYEMKRLSAVAKDGTLIPVTIFYKKGTPLNVGGPFFLIGYGSYGISYDPFFSVPLQSLADRGFICGIAHIRGGGDMGKQWHLDGKFLKKKNTFTDFIDVSEYLIAEGYTSPQTLVISGRSAGGLLMGAVMTMRPELFSTVVMEVPFVDALNTMLDETLPLTVGEYDEWGNPHKKEFYDYIYSYSPYDNIEKRDYPSLFMFTALNDTRVMYWEPLKFMAKLRKYRTDDNISVLKIDCFSGHKGASGRYDSLLEKAYQYSFLISRLENNKNFKNRR